MSVLSRFKLRVQNAQRRKTNKFIAHLHQQSSIVVKGAHSLLAYMQEPSKENAAKVGELERQADTVRRLLIQELNQTFVTPIDREDLFGLSRAIDDVLDYAYSTTNELDILNVRPNKYLRAMAHLLVLSAQELQKAMEQLEHQPKQADVHVMRAKAIGNRMDQLYAKALADLFNNPRDLADVVEMLKLREIYRHMYHAIGSAEQAADVISDIRVKFY
jgi:predicted phosphate transport protein (TIGR00153 family)